MSNLTFNEQLDKDIDEIFLKGEFSQTAIHRSGDNIRELTVQFFEEPLDGTNTRYHHAWCAYSDVPQIKVNDTLTILGITYGIVDFEPDDFHSGLNLFLQKV
jgi:hypothetical protein